MRPAIVDFLTRIWSLRWLTRVAVELLIDMIASGVTETEILENYPRLTHEDIVACVAYAETS